MSEDPTVCEVCWKNPCACPPRTEYRWFPGARGGPGDYKPVIEPGVAAIISKPLAHGSHASDRAARAATVDMDTPLLAIQPRKPGRHWRTVLVFGDEEEPMTLAHLVAALAVLSPDQLEAVWHGKSCPLAEQLEQEKARADRATQSALAAREWLSKHGTLVHAVLGELPYSSGQYDAMTALQRLLEQP